MAAHCERDAPPGTTEGAPALPSEPETENIAPAQRAPGRELPGDEDVSFLQRAPASSVQWQCLLYDGGYWSDYDRTDGAKIEAAFQEEKGSVMLGTADEDDQWQINFIAMVQITIKTETRRSIRRVLITHR